MVTGFGTQKVRKPLENGTLWNQIRVKRGSRTSISKNDPGPVGMLKKVSAAHFEPVVTRFGHPKVAERPPKCAVLEPNMVKKE